MKKLLFILFALPFFNIHSFGQLSWTIGNLEIDVDILDFKTVEQKNDKWVIQSKDMVIISEVVSKTTFTTGDNANRDDKDWGKKTIRKYEKFLRSKGYLIEEIKKEKWGNSEFVNTWSYKAMTKNFPLNRLNEKLIISYYAGVDKKTDTGYVFIIYSNSLKKIEALEHKIKIKTK